MNWGFLLLRVAIGTGMLTLLFLSQRFWYRGLWRVTADWPSTVLRVAARVAYVAGLLLIIFATADALRTGRGRILPRGSMVTALAGLWMFSALFAFLGVKIVAGVELLWGWSRRLWRTANKKTVESKRSGAPDAQTDAQVEMLIDPSRRYFFRTLTAVAGATPFLGAMYGFAAERWHYQVRRIEIPIPKLPAALDGMTIVQLSDIHLSGYMPKAQVRRAVDMANELGADLAVVTGDFITGASDPLGDCIDEIRHLHAPLGTWGCNGNHEIYAQAEDAAQSLFAQAGMKLLRQESAQLKFKDACFNLIGVDYQRERTKSGHRQQTLGNIGGLGLVRRDMPNILLSHNPNSFERAAELGIELSLAGHTHGGQIQVEILDHRLSPARFITNYVAGVYQRPLFAPAVAHGQGAATIGELGHGMSTLYVNRGLGTVGAPVRLGVPPEITLITLRSA